MFSDETIETLTRRKSSKIKMFLTEEQFTTPAFQNAGKQGHALKDSII